MQTQKSTESPAPPRNLPEWRQPESPEMGRVEAPMSEPYQPPDGMERFHEFVQPEGMQTEETHFPRVRRDPAEPKAT